MDSTNIWQHLVEQVNELQQTIKQSNSTEEIPFFTHDEALAQGRIKREGNHWFYMLRMN